jgi:hypothetical protein
MINFVEACFSKIMNEQMDFCAAEMFMNVLPAYQFGKQERSD